VMHHIVTDGWSMSILFDEIAQFYRQIAVGNRPEMAALPLQYGDFAQWQVENVTEEVRHEDIEYWRDKLHGCPDLLELRVGRLRPPAQSPRGSIESFMTDRAVTRQVKELCNREGVTLYMALLAVFEVLLLRYTGKEDIAIGTPVAGRNDPD